MGLFERLNAALGSVGISTGVLMSWDVMAVLIVLALIVKGRLTGRGVGKLQSVFELFMESLCSLIREIVRSDPAPYVPLAGTLFLFVFVSNLVGMFPPPFSSPTGDLSVTAALAAVVFLAVPFYGIRARGLRNYLRGYVQPNPFLLPLNVLGELTRTLALAVRLFGNIMSGEFLLLVIIGVVTTVLRGYAQVFIVAAIPLTLFLAVLSLIVAAIQAYIFTVLALVYIGAAVERRVVKKTPETEQQ
jgi:F-type H+-transporting ATPase subunit a